MTSTEISQGATGALSAPARVRSRDVPATSHPWVAAIAMSAIWVGALSVLLSSGVIFIHAMGQIASLCPSHLPC